MLAAPVRRSSQFSCFGDLVGGLHGVHGFGVGDNEGKFVENGMLLLPLNTLFNVSRPRRP
jgi:hypothetical protein